MGERWCHSERSVSAGRTTVRSSRSSTSFAQYLNNLIGRLGRPSFSPIPLPENEKSSQMFRLKQIALLLGSLFFIDAGKIFLPTNYHVRPRFLVCNLAASEDQVAGCRLLVDKEKVDSDPECFSEPDKNGEPRSYCRLLADDADWCDPIFKVPNDNHKCNKFFNYETERRDDGWYIWRADRCLNQTISILVHCQWAQKSSSSSA